MAEERTIRHWLECLARVKPDDILARFMIEGQIKQLERKEKAALEAAELARLKDKATDIVPENNNELIKWLEAEKVREEK